MIEVEESPFRVWFASPTEGDDKLEELIALRASGFIHEGFERGCVWQDRSDSFGREWCLWFQSLYHYCVWCGNTWRSQIPFIDRKGRASFRDIPLWLDHIIPESKGGILAPGNVSSLCGDCNGRKSDKALKDLPLDVARRIKVNGDNFYKHYLLNVVLRRYLQDMMLHYMAFHPMDTNIRRTDGYRFKPPFNTYDVPGHEDFYSNRPYTWFLNYAMYGHPNLGDWTHMFVRFLRDKQDLIESKTRVRRDGA